MAEDSGNPKVSTKQDGGGPKNWIGETVDQMGRIFRHMLPGLALLLIARLSQPCWFQWVDYRDKWHLVVLGTIAIIAGNMLYVFHRYSLHQIIDWLNYRFWSRKDKGRDAYLDWVVEHVDKSFHWVENDDRLRDHVNLRSAQIIFLFVTSEIALVFSFFAQPGSFFEAYRWFIRPIALTGLISAYMQQYVGFRLDVHLTGESKKETALGSQQPKR